MIHTCRVGRLHTSVRAFVLGAVACVVLLSGCGGNDSSSNDAGATATGSGNPNPTPSATPNPASPAPTGSPSATPTAAPTPGATAMPTVSPSPTGNPIAPVSGKGLFDCPATELPAYAVSTGVTPRGTLSHGYSKACVACHGATGQGTAQYPAINGVGTEAQFIAKVRVGGVNMPAHDAALISDAELKNDYAILRQLGATPAASVASMPGANSWTVAQVEQTYQRGLAVWRKAGAIDGQACANCHSPDGVDLALIGFNDDAILRRAHKHLSAADGLAVRDLIHAQRKRFNIEKTCSTQWRPFQPGGEVLPGKTPEEQDRSFRDQMVARNSMLFTGKITTLADAKKAWAELQAVDLRKLPIGIALPRWTEDPFNGAGHNTLNDYMPGVPAVPNNAAQFYAKEDAYLASPTDAGLYQLIDMFSKETNDGGFDKAFGVSDPVCNGDRTTMLTNSLRDMKRRSNLIAQHMFRQALLKKESWFDKGRSPFPAAASLQNPMFHFGGENVEPFFLYRCGIAYDKNPRPSLLSATPKDDRVQLSAKDAADGRMEDLSKEFSHTWMTLGQLYDQTLMSTEPQPENKLGYWVMLNFDQRDFHMPFFYAHRTATQSMYWTDLRGTAAYPKALGYHGYLKTHPLLNGATLFQGPLAGIGGWGYADVAGTLKFRGNITRMFLLLQRELLQNGAAVNSPQGNEDHCTSLGCQLNSWGYFMNDVRNFFKDQHNRSKYPAFTQQDMDFYLTDTEKLLEEVKTLVTRAPVVN